jgi:hypothetical protein
LHSTRGNVWGDATRAVNRNSFLWVCKPTKEEKSNVSYSTNAEAVLKMNDNRFKNMHEVDGNYYEILQGKITIVHSLPILIAFFVYSDAKLALLRFNHNFVLANIPHP